MSLDYDSSAIPTSVTLITVGGEVRVNPVTQALAMATQIVGMRAITEASAPEFYARVHIHEMFNGALLHNIDGPKLITPGDVRDHIGLKSNANTQTDAAFRRDQIASAMKALAESYKRAPRAWTCPDHGAECVTHAECYERVTGRPYSY